MPTKTPGRLRPETILLLIALGCAVALLVMVVLCLPYFGQEPDQADHPLHTKDPQQQQSPPPTQPTVPPAMANPYDHNDFQYQGDYLKLLHGDSVTAIDVSAYQGEIDWEAVKAAGVDIAIIRVGLRGYGKSGRLAEDERARENLEGASAAGLKVGVYFFSQALNTQEVDEEIDLMLEIIRDYEITSYVVFDWEYISAEARTANMDARTLTDCSLHFCKRMEAEGYTPMVYFNTYQSQQLLYLEELQGYDFWLARYSDRMRFPYRVKMWQYTDSGRVPGIRGNVDINVYFPE